MESEKQRQIVQHLQQLQAEVMQLRDIEELFEKDPVAAISLASDRGISFDTPYDGVAGPRGLKEKTISFDPTQQMRDLLYFELYKRNAWTRAVIDEIAREATKRKFRVLYNGDERHEIATAARKWFNVIGGDKSLESLLRVVLTDILIYGKAFLAFRPDQVGRLYEMYRLDARITNPDISTRNELLGFIQEWQGLEEYFQPQEVLYFYVEGGGGPYVPMSPMMTLMYDVAMDIAATRFNMSFWRNATNVGMIFYMDTTKERVERNREYITDKFSKPENAWKPMILEGESGLVRDGTSVIKDISFTELSDLSRLKVCAVYNTPQSEIGVSEDVNRNVKQGNREGWLDTCITPWQEFLVEAVNIQAIQHEIGIPELEVQLPTRSRYITTDEAEVSASVARRGATFNEIRAITQHPPIDNGDQLVVFIDGVGYVPLEFPITPDEIMVWRANQAPGPEEQPRSEEDDYNEKAQSGDKVAQSTIYRDIGDVVDLPIIVEDEDQQPWEITEEDIRRAVEQLLADPHTKEHIVDEDD